MRRWVLLTLLFSNFASAEPKPKPTNLALTLSGGVSLGVYQAGFLYFATETVKSSEGRMRVPILTGASAGSANALITAINLCSPPNPDPTADLGWQTWLPVGHRELFLPEEVSAIHIFSKKQILLALERIRLRYKEGLPEDCDLVLGISVTRLSARQVELGPGLFVPRLDERMVVRIRGRGLGQPVWVTNYLDPSSPVSHPLLPFATEKEPDPDQDFDLLRDLIFASGAFPLAFAPQPLKHCLNAQTSTTAVMRCQSPPVVLPFIDGGVFDNNPLRLSTSLVQQGLQVQGDRLVWRPVPNGDGPGPEVLHVYLDPDSTAYPALEEKDDPGTSDDALSLTWLLGREFIATARAKELAALVDASGELKSRMRLTQSNYPMASAQLGAFLGFFEKEFRRFDFYLGMFDAYVDLFVRARAPPELDRARIMIASGEIPATWRPFTCMMGWYLDGHEAARESCNSNELLAFRILMQVALDRLYDVCRRFEPQALGPGRHHPHCRRAAEGRTPPRIVPLATDFVRGPEESELSHTLRLLAAYRFPFTDLGLTAEEARYGRIKIRRRLLSMVTALAEAQPDAGPRALLLTAGRNAVNTIAYEPPKNWLYVGIGTVVEAGASVLPFDWNESWARLNLALEVRGLSSVLTPQDLDLQLALTAGPELELFHFAPQLLSPSFGIRGGYQFGSADHFHGRPCTEDRTRDDKRSCSQPVIHSYLAFAVLERLRLQVTGEFFPLKKTYDDKFFDLQLSIGVHFY